MQRLMNFLRYFVPSKFMIVIYSLKLLIETFKVQMKLAHETMDEVFDFIESWYPDILSEIEINHETFAL